MSEQTEKKPGRQLIPNSPELDESETSAISAVKAYERAEKKLRTFVGEHGEVFDTYRELLDKLEKKRVVADAAIRSTDASFGPWVRLGEQCTYDRAALCKQIGEERFVALGGTVSTQTVYELDKDKIDVAIAADEIPASVLAAVREIKSRYKAPKTVRYHE